MNVERVAEEFEEMVAPERTLGTEGDSYSRLGRFNETFALLTLESEEQDLLSEAVSAANWKSLKAPSPLFPLDFSTLSKDDVLTFTILFFSGPLS